jgi:DNA-binding NarL/FixJ family response regulator
VVLVRVGHPPGDRSSRPPAVPELADQGRLGKLTPRERQVLELVARGLSNREIAGGLVVEESTVRMNVKRILMKLDLRERIQAVSPRPGDGRGLRRRPAG